MMSFSIGPVTVYAYGLALAVAALISLGLAKVAFRKAGVAADTLSWFAVLAVPFGVLGARLLYCLVRLPWFLEKGRGYFFRLTDGGFMLYGALAGILLAAFLAARIKRQPFAYAADALSAPAALMICLSRLAEGLAGVGYGWPVADWFDPWMSMSLVQLEDYEWLQRFPFAMQEPMYEQWCWAIYVMEALVALVILIVVLRMKNRRGGAKTLMMVLIYAAMQVLGESARQDEVMRWGFIRVSQLISALAVAAVLVICCVKMQKKCMKLITLSSVGVLACAGVVMAMEFALEKKITALTWMPMDLCYIVTILGCLGLIACVLPAWFRAFPVEDEA